MKQPKGKSIYNDPVLLAMLQLLQGSDLTEGLMPSSRVVEDAPACELHQGTCYKSYCCRRVAPRIF